MKYTVARLFVFFLFLPVAVKAANQEAHVHGLATLTLALDKEFLEVQLESPSSNLVGFEHEAISPEEKQAVAKTKAILLSPTQLFSFVGTSCELKDTDIVMPEDMEGEHDHHEEGHHEEDVHGEDAHDEDHHHADHSDENSHSEIKANYRFYCGDMEKLRSIGIELFDLFPRIEKINAMWVTDVKQGAELLSPEKSTLYLK